MLILDSVITDRYKIYHNDFLLAANSIPNGSVDLVVTDPPYRVISGGKPNKKGDPSGMLSKNDGKIFDYNDIDARQWFPEIYRVLKQNTHCYVMTNTINLDEYIKIAKDVGFKIHNILVWEKNNATPNRWYMKNGEFILFLRKGKAKSINNKGSKMIHSFSNILGGRFHPTEKPVELMKFYIENSSNVDDVVLDPFMGSGSVGVACIQSGRKFIGCEIDSYYDIAKYRLQDAERDVI